MWPHILEGLFFNVFFTLWRVKNLQFLYRPAGAPAVSQPRRLVLDLYSLTHKLVGFYREFTPLEQLFTSY